jgi:serine/threonine protein kinase
MQTNAIANAEAAALEDCEGRDSFSVPNLKWKDFCVDPKILIKREKAMNPGAPSSASRPLRFSSSSSAPKLPSIGSTSNLAGSSSTMRPSRSLTQLNSAGADPSTGRTSSGAGGGLSASSSAAGLTPSKLSTSSLSSAFGGSSGAPHSNPNVIAHGNNSRVLLLAWQQPFDEEEPVAVKVYARSYFLTDQQLARARKEIYREAESNQMLHRKATKSDGFVRVYGVVTGKVTRPIAKLLHASETEECIGLVMKYESGVSLYQYLHNHEVSISIPDRLYILAMACKGLAEVHMAGLVHNDVQSRNVLMALRHGYEGSGPGGGLFPKWTGFGNSLGNKSSDYANEILQAKRRRSRCDSTTSEGSSANDSHPQYGIGFSLSLPSDSSVLSNSVYGVGVGVSLDMPFHISTAGTQHNHVPSNEPLIVYSPYTAPELLHALAMDDDDEDAGLTISAAQQALTMDDSSRVSPVPPISNVSSSNKLVQQQAQPSWRTDMYSFAILCWEVLTRSRPFDGEEMEGRLAVAVREGERPLLEDLKEIQTNAHLQLSMNTNAYNSPSKPVDGMRGECLTGAIIDTIEKCWSEDSYKRKSAMEMFCTLNHAYAMSSPAKFDMFISYCVEANKTLACYVYYWLTKLGYRVWMGINDDRSEWDPLFFGSKPTTPTTLPTMGPDSGSPPSSGRADSARADSNAAMPPVFLPPPPGYPGSPPRIEGKSSPRTTSDKHSSKSVSSPTTDNRKKLGAKSSKDANKAANTAMDEQFIGKIANCDVVLAFVNSSYQSQACCLTDLHRAKLCNPPKRIVAIVTEPHPFQWANRELLTLCDLHGHMFVDLSHVASLPEWDLLNSNSKKNSDPSLSDTANAANIGTGSGGGVIPTHIVTALKDSLVPLFTVLHEIDCFPSNVNNSAMEPAAEGTLEKSSELNKSCSVM